MDVLQKEHERLSKRLSSSKTVDEIQKTIDLLQEARNTIAAGTTERPGLAYFCPEKEQRNVRVPSR